jgi:hypothetical protein
VSVPYDRTRLVHVLNDHQRHTPAACLCGWSEWGASHAEHIADVYEADDRSVQPNCRATLVQQVAAVIEREGGRPGGNLHSWRCEWPLASDPPCDCIDQVARIIVAELLQEGGRDG